MLDEKKLDELCSAKYVDLQTFTLLTGEVITTKLNVELFRYIHDNLIKYNPSQFFGYFRPENIVKTDLTEVGKCEELIDIALDYDSLQSQMGQRFGCKKKLRSIVEESSYSVKWRHNLLDLELGISLSPRTIPYEVYIRYKDFRMMSPRIKPDIDKKTFSQKNIVSASCIFDYDLKKLIHKKRNKSRAHIIYEDQKDLLLMDDVSRNLFGTYISNLDNSQ
jgi:hypothetical protein